MSRCGACHRRRRAAVRAGRWSMNVSMPIAAVLLDLDFPAPMIKAIPLLARTGGLLAHLSEERQSPIGFIIAAHGEAAIACRKAVRTVSDMLQSEVEALPWEEQDEVDDGRLSSAVAYLFDPFALLSGQAHGGRHTRMRPIGGIEEIARLPFTEKDELRRARSRGEADGRACRRAPRPRSSGSTRPAAPPEPRAISR